MALKKGLNANDIIVLKKMRSADAPEKEIAQRLGVSPSLLKKDFTPSKVEAAEKAARESRQRTRQAFLKDLAKKAKEPEKEPEGPPPGQGK